KYYLFPAAFIAFFLWMMFNHYVYGLAIFALMNGYHIGMQNYGIMRLIDRKLGKPYRGLDNLLEKSFYHLSGTLPAVILALRKTGNGAWIPTPWILAPAALAAA